MCSCSEETTRNLIVNLKVLSNIGAGYKMNTKGKFIELDDSTWYQWILRKYRGDTRQCSIEKLTKLMDTTKQIVENAIYDIKNNIDNDEKKATYLNLNAKEFLLLMKEELIKTKSGIENLKDTYNYDTAISSQFEMHIILINKCINDIKKYCGDTLMIQN